MIAIFCSKKRDKANTTEKRVGYSHTTHFKTHIRKILSVSFSVLFLIPFIFEMITPSPVEASDISYFFDRTIEWNDGATERVQIGDDGFFYLDGDKRRLVGMDMGHWNLPYGEGGQFYIPENLAIYDKELSYLNSIGVRLVHINLVYTANWSPGISAEQERYEAFLDLAYKHKMFVIVHVVGKYFWNFGSLEDPNFDIRDGDLMGEWVDRMCQILSDYPNSNVVAIIADNELDYPLWPPDVPEQQ